MIYMEKLRIYEWPVAKKNEKKKIFPHFINIKCFHATK